MVAILGTGIMGLPMARNPQAAGLDVRAWNRTAELPVIRAVESQMQRAVQEGHGREDMAATYLASAPART